MARSRKRTRKKKSKKGWKIDFFQGKVFPWKLFLIVLFCASTISGVLYGARHFFLNNQFFTIKEIEVNMDRGYSFRDGEEKVNGLYLGRNMFTVNLRQAEMLIKNSFPQLKKVEVRRSFPDRLEIDIIGREPVAVIATGRGIVIDREAVVLAVGEKTKGLVRIKGISFFLNMPSRGESIKNKALDRAIVLLEGLRKKMRNDKAHIEYIDISDRNNILMGIYGVKVKMGTDDFLRKIDKLNQILNDPDISMEDINYIDLRFEEAVISLR